MLKRIFQATAVALSAMALFVTVRFTNFTTCTLYEWYVDDDHLSLEVEMQDGSLQEYWVTYDTDIALDASRVVFYTPNPTDFTTYEVVDIY